MARSYPSRRFPGGPYIEPSVNPALRGPKRTGPIGELVPGDDVEVARILARLGRKPLKDPICYEWKLTGDTTDDTQITAATTPPGDDPQFILTCRQDMALLSLVAIELSCTTVSSSGIVTMKLMNLTRTADEGTDIYFLDDDFPVYIYEGEYNNADEDDPLRYQIDWDNSQVQWRDRIGIYFPDIGTDVRGYQLGLWFR